jgi:DNA-binding MltR family transcriptional regulator
MTEVKMNNSEKSDEQKFLDELEGLVYSYLTKEAAASFRQLTEFTQTLNGESDRGAALVAAQILSEELAKLIKSKMVNDKKLIKDAFSVRGALGSLSGRIDHAFLLGLLPNVVRQDLNLLRAIRNEFAHSTESKTFETHSIKSRCMELTYYGIGNKNSSPRKVFLRSMALIYRMIILKTSRTEHLLAPDTPKQEEPEAFVKTLLEGIERTTLDPKILFKDADI